MCLWREWVVIMYGFNVINCEDGVGIEGVTHPRQIPET